MINSAVLAGVVISSVALAHGPTEDWIREGGYRDENGHSCCGEQDCKTLGDKEVREIRGGYAFSTVFQWADRSVPLAGTVPYSEAPPSLDGKFHVCVKFENGEAKRRCFFASVGGV